MADDLEGNWLPSAASNTTTEVERPAELDTGRRKKRKRSVSEVDAPVIKKRPAGVTSNDASCDDSQVPAAVAVSSSKKKRKKRAQKKQSKESAGLPGPQAQPKELGVWALSRFSTAWQEEVKAKSLSPLEAKEVHPVCEWFVPLLPSHNFKGLPPKFNIADMKQVPRSVGVLILCSSAERAFGIIEDLRDTSSKPVVLASHGGGRKRDQVKRQAASISKGLRLAVATPGRFLRLLDEGHAIVDGLRYVVVDLQQDRKQRDLLSLVETRSDVLSLTRRYLLGPLEAGSLRIALCGAS